MKIQKVHYACAALLAASVPTIALAAGTAAKILNPTVQCNFPSPYAARGTPEYTAKIKNTGTTAATYTATLVTVHEGKCLKRGPVPKDCNAGELGQCVGKCEKRADDTENTRTQTSDSIEAGKLWNLVIPLHANPEADSSTFKSATLTVKASGATGGVVSTSPRTSMRCLKDDG